MSVNHRHAASNGGFILLEALVSLILLSMILALFSSTLTFARRVAAAGNSREDISAISSGANAVSQWLAGAVPAREIGAGGEGPVSFDGRSDRLSFVTLSNGDTQPGGLLSMTIAFVGRGRTGTLAFSSSPVGIGASPVAPSLDQPQVLIESVTGLEFSYFGADDDGTPPAWHPSWRNASRLPTAVALRMTIDHQGRIEPLDLTFRIFNN
jgi:general secretion pathway protein J